MHHFHFMFCISRLEVCAPRAGVGPVAELQVPAVGPAHGPAEESLAGPAGTSHGYLDLASGHCHVWLVFLSLLPFHMLNRIKLVR